METMQIIQHFDKMHAISNMILAELQRISQLENLRIEKNWLFYTTDEKKAWIEKYERKLSIHYAALNRLNNYYITHSKLN